MQSDIKFTIAVPAYKASFFKECLDSLIGQTYRNFEIIILNDCSPESIEEIVNSYTDERILYYKNEQNVGAVDVVNNWNKCLEYATGDYFLCMGDDDMLAADCLEQYINLMDAYPDKDLYHARSLMIDEKSKYFDIQEDYPDTETAMSMLWHDLIKGRVHYVGDYLYKTEVLKACGGFVYRPLAWGSDYLTTYLAAAKSGVANMHKPVFLYRVNSQSITNTGNVKKKIISTKLYEEWLAEYTRDKADNENDEYLRQSIIKHAPSILEKRKLMQVADDLKCCHLTSLYYWIKNKRNYNLSTKIISKACIVALTLYLKK